MKQSRFEAAIAAFDALNAQDPNSVTNATEKIPKELHDARAMSRWIDTLYPNAPETVKLAARCQHLCRWEIPRSSYPEGRVAYLKWRNDLKCFHADKSEAVLKQLGYDAATVDAVRNINLKKGLGNDPGVQAVEDALCLVFLEFQFESYLGAWEEDKIIKILQKTWGKMSEHAREAALKLPFSPGAAGLIHQALKGE